MVYKKTKGYAGGGMAKGTKGYANGGMAKGKGTKGYANGGTVYMAKDTKGRSKGGKTNKLKGNTPRNPIKPGSGSKYKSQGQNTKMMKKKNPNRKSLLKPGGIDVFTAGNPPKMVYDASEAYRKQQKRISDSKRKKQRTGKK